MECFFYFFLFSTVLSSIRSLLSVASKRSQRILKCQSGLSGVFKAGHFPFHKSNNYINCQEKSVLNNPHYRRQIFYVCWVILWVFKNDSLKAYIE